MLDTNIVLTILGTIILIALSLKFGSWMEFRLLVKWTKASTDDPTVRAILRPHPQLLSPRASRAAFKKALTRDEVEQLKQICLDTRSQR